MLWRHMTIYCLKIQWKEWRSMMLRLMNAWCWGLWTYDEFILINMGKACFWSKAQNDHITNNMCKSFNQWLKKFRSKSILGLFENMRIKLMSRLQKKYAKRYTWEDILTPFVKTKLDKMYEYQDSISWYRQATKSFKCLKPLENLLLI